MSAGSSARKSSTSTWRPTNALQTRLSLRSAARSTGTTGLLPLYGDENVPVKSFLWVKVLDCAACGTRFDLFPGYVIAENRRHPKNVLVCPACGDLNEVDDRKSAGECASCGGALHQAGPARRGRCDCPRCGHTNAYPGQAKQPLTIASSRSNTTTRNAKPGTRGVSSRNPTQRTLHAWPMRRSDGGSLRTASFPIRSSRRVMKRRGCTGGGIPATGTCSIPASFWAWN